VVDGTADAGTTRLLNRTIDGVSTDFEHLHFNTAIAKLIELNNHLTKVAAQGPLTRDVAEPLVLMLAPLTPHVAEELWRRMGHDTSLAFEPFPLADPALLVADTIEYPVQVNGKVRARVHVAADADQATIEGTVLADAKVAAALDGKAVRKMIVVPGRMVNIVV
jgi:leucyl-tRNA synthetase